MPPPAPPSVTVYTHLTTITYRESGSQETNPPETTPQENGPFDCLTTAGNRGQGPHHQSENHHIAYLIGERQKRGAPRRSDDTTSKVVGATTHKWSRETNKPAITRAATHAPPRPTHVATGARRKRTGPPSESSRTAYTAQPPGTPPLQTSRKSTPTADPSTHNHHAPPLKPKHNDGIQNHPDRASTGHEETEPQRDRGGDDDEDTETTKKRKKREKARRSPEMTVVTAGNKEAVRNPSFRREVRAKF
ncbi:unnamed protein product [Brassica rapa subsp. narinosa]|uniref:Uncharacterized protein n=1 Tax=Brassica campestris TaxID=3711 RepID=M4DEF2_BRACM